ncbi:S1C family serine protease [Natrinema salifodinae]|uniref:Serine protease, S1-C subfamily, contains C-terminal PDZ domain n=1 Tax=Natrinema salifodinae TaxID=1202768 RepID=A0A1I0MCY4_9EURY|nr:trypsin-like peptidase domain-containing protein [Natrinema salifodinae]SEV86317.1 serine protease, S1-C subfamily, contains C-terminal PDZ domain [Natrinema salifodinae]
MSLVGVGMGVTPDRDLDFDLKSDPDQCTRRRLLGTVGTVGAVAALGLGGSGAGSAQNESTGANESDADSTDQADADVDSEYASVYQETIDSVVLVSVSGTGGLDGGGGGLGSGFVIDDEYVLTNNHVVEAAAEGGIELQFSTEEWRTASVVGTDAYSDLAVLQVEDMPDVAEALTLSESEPVIGQEVLAIGNPLGLNASISQGIVSGTNRSLPSPTGFSIPAAIQTDAPINPGNSGGPLVDLDGEVLGVVFAGAGQTIGFAISARLANRVVPALVEDGTYEHSFMGVGVVPVGPAIAEEIGLEEPSGVLVTQVVPNSPADGTLEPATTRPGSGDVIVAIDGQAIPNQEQLSSYLALETSPGDTIEIEVVRDGERETVELTLDERPDVQRPQSPIGGGPGVPGGPGHPGGPSEPDVPSDPGDQPTPPESEPESEP